MERYKKMSAGELKKQLEKLKEDFEEFEEERVYTLKLAGVHVPGATVKKYEQEKAGYLKEINYIQELLTMFDQQ